MSIRYLDLSGAVNFWTNIKNYILSKIPTKTSELTNDSGFLTQHQSLANYVTTNTDQDITGNKNFKGILSTQPDATLWASTTKTTSDIISLGSSAVHVEQKPSGNLTDLSGGAWTVAEFGIGVLFFRINNGADIRYKNLAQNTVNRIPVVSNANRFINDVTPDENNTYSLGTSSLRWSSCYCNAYYLGTTAFGDIVTHNASEFLASNGKAIEANKVQATIDAGTTAALVQATVASNDCFRIAAGGAANAGWAEIATGDDANEPIYVRQYKGSFTTLQRTATLLDGSGNTSFPGTVTATTFSGALSGNASTATQFSANTTVALTGDATGTSAGSKKGWSVPVTLANSGVTAGTYGPSADVTGNNNATISVPEITVDAKGRVTSVTNRTYTSVNTDTNTDTKVTQTVTNANSNYPIILSATADKTATSTEAARFTTALYANARYGYLYQKNTYASACKIGTAPTSDTVVARIYQKDYNGDDATQIYTQINKTTGHVRSYWRVYNKITSGALDPSATATSTYLDLTMGTAGKTIATDALWDSNLTPLANNSKTLGTSSLQWKGAYAVNFYENGTALSSKYAQVDNISANGIGTTCLLAFFPGGTGDLSLVAGQTKPGTSLCVVYWRLESGSTVSGNIYTTHAGKLVINRDYTETGTWKLLHAMSQGVTQHAMIGVWVRIL